MADLFDRFLFQSDYQSDGGPLNPDQALSALTLYSAGIINATQVKDAFGCTNSSQETDVDDILATMPTSLLSLTNALTRARWPSLVSGALHMGRDSNLFSQDKAQVKTAIGI